MRKEDGKYDISTTPPVFYSREMRKMSLKIVQSQNHKDKIGIIPRLIEHANASLVQQGFCGLPKVLSSN